MDLDALSVTTITDHHGDARDCLAGGGGMGALMRSVDWARTPLGPVERWPQSLRTAVSIMLESRFAMVVAWGPEFRFFYNDRYRPILGTKHPSALGTPGSEIFPEVWEVVGPEFERVRRGDAFAIDDWLLPLDRNGYLENCWFTLSYSPIRDETGGVGGLLAVVAETTGRVEGERRLATLRELARRASDAKTPAQACANAAEVLGANPIDVPFALIYLLDEGGGRASRVSVVGIAADHAASVETVTLGDERGDDPWQLTEVVRTGTMVVRPDLAQTVGVLPGGPYEQQTHTALLLPLSRPGLAHPYGVLVAGVSPRRALDDRYRDFFELAADHIATAISNAVALEEAQRRADALAEIDRAKTAFFSNVSHEFRTPLTLMLGPTEAALAAPEPVMRGADLEMVHRNQLRLLKLVNALLDFSRIEAGRAQAVYRLTDITRLTRDLAGAFQSTIESAGLRFEVACERIEAPVYVDRDMWEKVVLNLLSNAFKFTFEGSIAVGLAMRAGAVELTVRDTGTGIPEHEVPRVFERFHRVEGARSRTHEGSGIGLALTHELVRLHGGEITATSAIGRGSTFRVRIPTGRAHLPADRVDVEPALASTARGVAPFVEEARRWLPDAPAVETCGAIEAGGETDVPVLPAGAAHERILVVDDNADMRDYLARVLRHWRVDTARNGAEALDRVRDRPPDLVVTDVMMPELDGFGLLAALKSDPRTGGIPVLVLSARSGEEARISGLAAGADDYVTKPFSARELTARVRSLLALVEARREAERQKQHLHALFMQAPTPIVILRGKDHVIELANAMTCRVLGRAERDVLNRPLFEALPELEGQPFRALLDGVFQTGVPYVGKETPAHVDRRGDGSLDTAYFNFVYEPLRGRTGQIEGILVIAFDVTDEVRARDEMQVLRVAEQAANRTKDEFLAMLGHELRNPLSPILTALQLMTLRGDAGAERERMVIDRQVRHLVRLVDDLLDVSRIARGRIELQRQPLDLSDVVAAAIEGASPLLEERQHHMHLRVPRGLRVHGDMTRLTQVIGNVVTNAAKYTEARGHIHVSAARVANGIELRIRDTGIGISPGLLANVFDMFIQDRQAIDRSRGGLGLGLTIARSLVRLHGGTIEARSEGRGTGAEFIITLPALGEAAAGGDARPASSGEVEVVARAGRRVLVVDDNVDAARLIAAALDTVGCETRVAFDGPAAIALADGFRPHVVLLDLGLPLMDGFEVARQLRTSAAAGVEPLLVAVTGYGQASDFERTRAEGFHAHVVKPVDVHELVRLLDRLVSTPPATSRPH